MSRNTVFSQILQLICQYQFKKCVDQHKGDKYTKRFTCWQQLIVLLFAQAKGHMSLRDIEVSLSVPVTVSLGNIPEEERSVQVAYYA